MPTVPDETVETFEAAGLSEAEAKVQALRLQGLSRSEVADFLDVGVETVRPQWDRIDSDEPVRLSPVIHIEPDARVRADAEKAAISWTSGVVFTFGNGAKLQYRRSNIEETVYEDVFRADDPKDVSHSTNLVADPEEYREIALESLAEYVNTYRTDVEALREDWPSVYEALTLLPP